MRWGSEMGLDDALRVLFSEDFDSKSADAEPAIGKAMLFGETVATLVKHDLLDGDLVRDLLWVEGIWARVAEHAITVREKEGEPRLYENFEAFVVGLPVGVGAA
jgi:hypothetical protein